MEKSNNINISELPEFARAELLDFYEFLKAKHCIQKKDESENIESSLKRFVSKPIKVDKIIKYSRDELYAR